MSNANIVGSTGLSEGITNSGGTHLQSTTEQKEMASELFQEHSPSRTDIRISKFSVVKLNCGVLIQSFESFVPFFKKRAYLYNIRIVPSISVSSAESQTSDIDMDGTEKRKSTSQSEVTYESSNIGKNPDFIEANIMKFHSTVLELTAKILNCYRKLTKKAIKSSAYRNLTDYNFSISSFDKFT